MNNFEENGLKIVFDGKNLSWFGKSIFEDPSKKLDPYLESIIPKIEKSALEIHFENLEYINSSTIQSVIKLLRKLHEAQIKTKVIYNNDYTWQKTAFKALHILCTVMKNLSITGINR